MTEKFRSKINIPRGVT